MGLAVIVEAGELAEVQQPGAVGVGGLDPNRLCRVGVPRTLVPGLRTWLRVMAVLCG